MNFEETMIVIYTFMKISAKTPNIYPQTHRAWFEFFCNIAKLPQTCIVI